MARLYVGVKPPSLAPCEDPAHVSEDLRHDHRRPGGGRRTGGRAVEPVGPGRARARSHGPQRVPCRPGRLAAVQGPGPQEGEGQVRLPGGPARLRQPDGSDHPARGLADPAHQGPLPRRGVRQPRRPRRECAAVLAARRRHPARRRQDLRLVRHGPARRRGVYPGAELRPEVRQLPAPAVPAHDHGDPELLAGQDRGVRRRVRHLGGEGPAAAPEDDGQRGGLRVAPHRDRAGAGDLLRLLLRHLPRAGVGHPAPGLAQGDGARRRREPRPRLVPGEPRPGPRLRDRLQEVLHVDRQARPHLPPGPLRPAGRQAVREAAQAAGEEAGPGQARRR